MKLTLELANEFFRGFYIERWNDIIRPMPFYEIDKHGHKLIIAYCIAKYEENKGNKIEWETIIKDSVFELLRRIIISDIKSPIYQEIRKEQQVFHHLNEYVFKKLENKFGDETLKNDFKLFLDSSNDRTSLTHQVIDAAHTYASYWEFRIVEATNPFTYQNEKTKWELTKRVAPYLHLEGISRLLSNFSITNFIDLCGQLRFQIRWSQTPRVPKTSVLGHVMLVAVFTYLISLDVTSCEKRIYNNFFGGIFHDLPETVTRDIISPVKKSSPELDSLISHIEKKLTEKEIYPYLDEKWIDEIKYFTQDEFKNKIIDDGTTKFVTIDEINKQYDHSDFSPYDGEIVRFADHFSAYLEATNSIKSGIKSDELIIAANDLKEFYLNKKICDLDISVLFK